MPLTTLNGGLKLFGFKLAELLIVSVALPALVEFNWKSSLMRARFSSSSSVISWLFRYTSSVNFRFWSWSLETLRSFWSSTFSTLDRIEAGSRLDRFIRLLTRWFRSRMLRSSKIDRSCKWIRNLLSKTNTLENAVVTYNLNLYFNKLL